jgi:hypothetical protein
MRTPTSTANFELTELFVRLEGQRQEASVLRH